MLKDDRKICGTRHLYSRSFSHRLIISGYCWIIVSISKEMSAIYPTFRCAHLYANVFNDRLSAADDTARIRVIHLALHVTQYTVILCIYNTKR